MDVLVVDDTAEIRQSLAELLREEGYSVGELESGAGLVETIAAERPCLVLLDLTMPRFEPGAAIDDLRARGLRAGIAIVALSGIDSPELVALELDLDGAVRKPFDVELLLETVERFVRRGPTPPGDRPGARL